MSVEGHQLSHWLGVANIIEEQGADVFTRPCTSDPRVGDLEELASLLDIGCTIKQNQVNMFGTNLLNVGLAQSSNVISRLGPTSSHVTGAINYLQQSGGTVPTTSQQID